MKREKRKEEREGKNASVIDSRLVYITYLKLQKEIPGGTVAMQFGMHCQRSGFHR